MQPDRNKDREGEGKGGFESKIQTAWYEAARYMMDWGDVIGRGVASLSRTSVDQSTPFILYFYNRSLNMEVCLIGMVTLYSR